MTQKYIPVDEFINKLDIMLISASNAPLREALKEWGKTIAVEAMPVDEVPIDALDKQKAAIDKLYEILDDVCKDTRERSGNDLVCGLCQYDADHGEYGDANECPGFERDDCFCMKNEIRGMCGKERIPEPFDDFEYNPADWED